MNQSNYTTIFISLLPAREISNRLIPKIHQANIFDAVKLSFIILSNLHNLRLQLNINFHVDRSALIFDIFLFSFSPFISPPYLWSARSSSKFAVIGEWCNRKGCAERGWRLFFVSRRLSISKLLSLGGRVYTFCLHAKEAVSTRT